MFQVREIDVQGLSTLGDDVRFIDVRTPQEVAAGAIPGATHIPLHLLPLRLSEFDRDVPTVIYCRTGARSAQACAFLAAQGLDNTWNLAGGIMAWARSGGALARVA